MKWTSPRNSESAQLQRERGQPRVPRCVERFSRPIQVRRRIAAGIKIRDNFSRSAGVLLSVRSLTAVFLVPDYETVRQTKKSITD